MHPMFAFERTGLTSDGSIIGRHVQKAASSLANRFRAAGLVTGAAAGEVG